LETPSTRIMSTTIIDSAKLSRVNFEVIVTKTSFPERYTVLKYLCDSLYGKVFLANDNRTGNQVAIKCCSLQKMEGGALFDAGQKDDPRKEVEIMLKLQQDHHHQNLIQLVDHFEVDDMFVVCTEFASGGEIFQRITPGIKPVRMVLPGFLQICKGLRYIHQRGIAHLDISLENVLLGDDGVWKICDFGVAHDVFSQQQLNPVGKEFYVAPEVVYTTLRCDEYDPRIADIYSLGVCLFMLCFSFQPYNRPSSNDPAFVCLMKDGVRVLLQRYQLVGTSHELLCLLEMLLSQKPRHRANIEQVVTYIEDLYGNSNNFDNFDSFDNFGDENCTSTRVSQNSTSIQPAAAPSVLSKSMANSASCDHDDHHSIAVEA